MTAKLPPSLKADMLRWSPRRSISVEDWVSNVGTYDLTVGYLIALWPRFETFDGYLLTEGRWSEDAVRDWEKAPGITPDRVEWLLNHRHLIHMFDHHEGVPASPDHLRIIGGILKEIYEAKLSKEFPDRPCEVDFHIPDDEDMVEEYQISFFQKKWRE